MRYIFSLITLLITPSVLIAEETTYYNPIDGQGYRAGWERHSPAKPAPKNKHVNITEVVLLTEDKTVGDNVSVSELADLINSIEKVLITTLGEPTQSFPLLVQTTLSKDKPPQFKISYQGEEVSKQTLQQILDSLQGLNDLRSKSEDIIFQVYLDIQSK
jgi:hypothetical protein